MEIFFLVVLIGFMAAALSSGYPVAFALPGSAILTVILAAASGYVFAGNVDAFFAHGGPTDWLSSGVTNFRGIYWEAERDTLIAIPLFVFMGIMLQRSKIAEDLLVTMAQLFGPVPGGLGISVIFVGALLAATTGILGATVVAMGLISLPAMLRNNYSQSLATGAIAASGTLGQIIPPSIVLIILADQLASAVDQAGTARKELYKEATGSITMPSEFSVISTSAGEMFLGAIIPGLILVAFYMIYILVVGIFRPKMAPSVQFDGKIDGKFLARVSLILLPPLVLIFAVLGSIITGVATVNQAGAIGAAGAIIMAGYRLREGQPMALAPATLALASLIGILILTSSFDINAKRIESFGDFFVVLLALIAVGGFLTGLIWSGWRTYKTDDTLKGVMVETAKTTSLVFIILLGAAMLTAAFRAFGGEELVREFLTSLPGGFWGQFIIVMMVMFVLGFFLDFIEIAVVVVPIVAPILLMDPEANVTAVWLGVMIGVNMQTSFLTPPFGFALFYLRGVAPAVVRTVAMYKGVMPFIALQLLALVTVGNFPFLVNYLPNRNLLSSETAPPPRNPALQHCLEAYKFSAYAEDETALRAAISAARGLDIGYLPKRETRNLKRAFDAAEEVFDDIAAVRKAEAALQAKSQSYRPLHHEVRAIQRRARRVQDRIEELKTKRSQARGNQQLIASLDARISRLQQEQSSIKATIPANWEAENKEFAALLKAETDARRKYRRAADAAYTPIITMLKTLQATPAFIALEQDIKGLGALLDDSDTKSAAEKVNALYAAIRQVEGAGDVRSAITKLRREFRRKTVNKANAQQHIDEAVEKYDAQLVWRGQAAQSLLDGLTQYDAAIRTTIGLRQQPRLPREPALYVAACKSEHRDISLYF
ncbi:MAG: TRAP transporter large permease subunit [Pseudomonadota bacterium]